MLRTRNLGWTDGRTNILIAMSTARRVRSHSRSRVMARRCSNTAFSNGFQSVTFMITDHKINEIRKGYKKCNCYLQVYKVILGQQFIKIGF